MRKPVELVYNSVTGKIWKGSREVGSLDNNGYRRVCFNGKRPLAHRLAWFLYYGEWPTDQIDHINGNKDDNRISNLRLASDFQNMWNRGKPQNNTSGFKGVSWHKQRQKWIALIGVNGVLKYLGYFEDLEKAAAAYQTAAIKYHGEFANLDL